MRRIRVSDRRYGYSQRILATKDREIFLQRTAISNVEAGKSVPVKAKLIA